MFGVEEYLRQSLASAQRKATTVDSPASKRAYLDLVDHYRIGWGAADYGSPELASWSPHDMVWTSP